MMGTLLLHPQVLFCFETAAKCNPGEIGILQIFDTRQDLVAAKMTRS
jgi:hypothetical protein